MKDAALADYLVKHKIFYIFHEHEAVFTVESAMKLKVKWPHIYPAKNLFLKDECGNFYLLCMYANEKLNAQNLKRNVNAKGKLSFASAEELKEHLHLEPGHVSIFGMIYSKGVKLVLDKRIWKAPIVGFHPNVNTATLELTHESFKKFFDSLECEKEIVDMEN